MEIKQGLAKRGTNDVTKLVFLLIEKTLIKLSRTRTKN